MTTYLTIFIQRLTGTEWSERWGSWPHCNGQARCWMHIDPDNRWCQCSCNWCRIARKVRREGRR